MVLLRSSMEYRQATCDDVPYLARMDIQRRRDEGASPIPALPVAEQRMNELLDSGCEAVVFGRGNADFGYVLYRRESASVRVLEFFVKGRRRHQGVGRTAFQWLAEHVWDKADRICLDIRKDNSAALTFWESLGFEQYSVGLQLSPVRPAEPDSGTAFL